MGYNINAMPSLAATIQIKVSVMKPSIHCPEKDLMLRAKGSERMQRFETNRQGKSVVVLAGTHTPTSAIYLHSGG